MFRKNKSKVFSVLLSILLVVVLAACSGNNKDSSGSSSTTGTGGSSGSSSGGSQAASKDEVITLRYTLIANHLAEGHPQKKIIDKFMELNPNIKIETESNGDTGDHINKMKMLASTGSMPDLFFSWVGSAIDPFVESKTVMNLTNELDDEWKSYYAEQTLEKSKHSDGNIYIIPYERTILGYYVNTSVFEQYGVKVPETYEELKTAIEVFNNNDIIPWVLGSKDDWSTSWMIDDFYVRYDNNLEYVNKVVNGEARFQDNPEFIKGLEKLTELNKLGAFPKNATSMTYEQAKQMFFDKKAAMISSGTFLMSEINANMKPEDIDQVAFIPFPAFADSQYAQNTISQNYAGGIAAAAHLEGAKREAALKFLKFVAGPEAHQIFMELKQFTGTSLPVDEAIVGPLFKKVVAVGEKYDGFKHSYYSFPAAFQQPYYKATVELAAGLITAEEYLKKLDSALDDIRN